MALPVTIASLQAFFDLTVSAVFSILHSLLIKSTTLLVSSISLDKCRNRHNLTFCGSLKPYFSAEPIFCQASSIGPS